MCSPMIAALAIPALSTTSMVAKAAAMHTGFPPKVEACDEDVLSILQLVIVALSGILREVLDELPIIALRIVKVPALAIRMCIGRRGVCVSG